MKNVISIMWLIPAFLFGVLAGVCIFAIEYAKLLDKIPHYKYLFSISLSKIYK